jgi:hypothetical protein
VSEVIELSITKHVGHFSGRMISTKNICSPNLDLELQRFLTFERFVSCEISMGVTNSKQRIPYAGIGYVLTVILGNKLQIEICLNFIATVKKIFVLDLS